MERFSNKFVSVLLVSAVVIGVLSDLISLSDKANPNDSYFGLGFYITLPIFLLLFMFVLSKTKIRNKFLITLFDMLLFLGVMIFTFWFYNFRKGGVSDMYGL